MTRDAEQLAAFDALTRILRSRGITPSMFFYAMTDIARSRTIEDIFAFAAGMNANPMDETGEAVRTLTTRRNFTT